MVAPVQKSKTAPIKPTTAALPAAAPAVPAQAAAATGRLGQDATSAKATEAAEAGLVDIEAIDVGLAAAPKGGSAARPGKGKGHGDAAADASKNSIEVGYDTEKGLKTGVTLHANEHVSLEAHTSQKNGKTHADATVRYKDETLDASAGYDTEKGVNGGLSVKATDAITLTVHAAEFETASGRADKGGAAKGGAKATTKTTGAKPTGGKDTKKPAVAKGPEGPHVDAAIDYKDDQTTARLAYDSQKGVSGSVSRKLDDRWKVSASAAVRDGQTELGGKLGYKDKTTEAELGYSTKDGVTGQVAYQATKELKLEVDGSYNQGRAKARAKGTYQVENTKLELGYGTEKGLDASVTQKLDERFSVGASLTDGKKLSAMVKFQEKNWTLTTQVGSINKIEAAYRKDNLEAGAFVSHDRDHGTAAGVSLKLHF